MKKRLSPNPSEEPQEKLLPENPPESMDSPSGDSPAPEQEPADSSDEWPDGPADSPDDESAVETADESADETADETAVGPRLMVESSFQDSSTLDPQRDEKQTPFSIERIKKVLTVFFTILLPAILRKARGATLVLVSKSKRYWSAFRDQIRKSKSIKGKRKRPEKIKRTSRERVYKLRGYTTIEKVNARRKAQRRFKLAQRVLITALCVGVIGYFAFKNNPFTDVDELLRIIGIRNTQSVLFHQFIFPLKMVEGSAVGTLLPEEDIVQIVKDNGRADDLFYIMDFKDLDAFKATLARCKRTLSDEDILQLSRDRKIGTVLVMVGVEGNTRSYRFSDITKAGVMMEITATTLASSEEETKLYVIGLLSSSSYAGYSYDVTLSSAIQTALTTKGK